MLYIICTCVMYNVLRNSFMLIFSDYIMFAVCYVHLYTSACFYISVML